MENNHWNQNLDFSNNFIEENSNWDSRWYQIDSTGSEDDYHPTKKSVRRQQCTVRKVQQRTAANQRERRRMKTINEAFDNLRTSIPISDDDHKLSKVDTLRLAIRYIQRLRDIVHVTEDHSTQNHHQVAPECNNKVIITYPTPECSPSKSEEETSLIGHSLSWEPEEVNQSDRTLRHKVWLPQSPHSLYMGDL